MDHSPHDIQQESNNKARRLEACRLRIALFKGLQVDTMADRQTSLEKIIQVVKSYMRMEEDRDEQELQYYQLTMLRLAYTCPFADVRQTFQYFLKQTLEADAMPTPHPSHLSPSYFIPLNDIFSLESTSSANTFITYPRPSHVSLSPWSHDTADDDKSSSFSSSTSFKEYDEQRLSTRGKCTGGRPSDEYVRTMLIRSFIEDGRLSNMYRVMAFFPTYYELFQSGMNSILKQSNGRLGRSWRSFVGIMACAEQQCQYLVSMLKLDFLQYGGDTAWLKGLHHCPWKLQRLGPFVKKLARQPWRLQESDLQSLMTGALPESWNKAELVEVIVILSSFLSLCNFVLGCGIRPEMDMYGGYTMDGSSVYGVENELDDTMMHFQNQKRHEDMAIRAASAATGWYDSHISSRSNTEADDDEEVDDDDIDKGALHLVDKDDDWQPSSLPSHQHVLQRTTQLISRLKTNKDILDEQLREQLAGLNLYTTSPTASTQDDTTSCPTVETNEQETVNKVMEDLYRFIDHEVCVPYASFSPDNPDDEEFMLSEYCWEDQGCDLVNHFLPDMGDILDDEFNEALSITDWSIFHQAADGQVDTSPLRLAIFYYVQKLLGVIKDDYNYDDIPTYLCEDTKHYIERVCQQPHQLTRHDWNNIGLSLRPEEKCHVNVLIQTARKQALLCYGLSLVSHI
ncbi:PA26-domain-containing protein [Hesseltinella vesiculosa]|uniref:PA26-domain-containing protein n=1 Tax=Hesseltinella vesiculosa TaxID=101127 RepID=A0A1X2GC86_9FUNG|nr:PA26-domain-containing protein [Hesseltinella vesiculosa]